MKFVGTQNHFVLASYSVFKEQNSEPRVLGQRPAPVNPKNKNIFEAATFFA